MSLLFVSGSLIQLTAQTKVAVLEVRNQGRDARYDYVGALISGILQFDLSRSEDLALVERNRLDKVLEEQELRLSGLINNPASVSLVGRLASVDFLIEGEFVFLGSEILLTLKAVDVTTARASVYSDRGSDENLVHRLISQMVQGITGKPVTFTVPTARSLISMRDEAPGIIALFTPLQEAQIFLDGVFYGYTKGDPVNPIEISVRPGKHRIETRLGNSMGVIDMPAIVFRPWFAEVEVTSGGRHTVRDETRHFNSILYRMKNLLSENPTIPESGYTKTHTLSFQDRTGKEIPITLTVEVRKNGAIYNATLRLSVDTEITTFTLNNSSSSQQTAEQIFGLVKFNSELNMRNNRIYFSYSLTRTDVHQGMHQE